MTPSITTSSTGTTLGIVSAGRERVEGFVFILNQREAAQGGGEIWRRLPDGSYQRDSRSAGRHVTETMTLRALGDRATSVAISVSPPPVHERRIESRDLMVEALQAMASRSPERGDQPEDV